MNCELISRTLVLRLLLMMTVVGGVIAISPQLNLGSTANTATRTAFKQQMSIQVSAQ